MTRFVLTTLALLTAPLAFAGTWNVDASHSHVGFAVSHMTISTVKGSFGDVKGTVEYDPANLAGLKIDATIRVDSVNTQNADRDAHLKQADFFDTTTFPEMKFKSKAVRNITKGGFDIVGDLTLRGVTKEVVLKATPFTAELKDPWGNTKTAVRATTTINRQDFGVKYSSVLDNGGLVVGNEVTIDLDIQLAKAK